VPQTKAEVTDDIWRAPFPNGRRRAAERPDEQANCRWSELNPHMLWIGLPRLRLGHPVSHEQRQFTQHFASKEDLINVTHVEHIDDATQI
jgi:hypothetical protein